MFLTQQDATYCVVQCSCVISVVEVCDMTTSIKQYANL